MFLKLSYTALPRQDERDTNTAVPSFIITYLIKFVSRLVRRDHK